MMTTVKPIKTEREGKDQKAAVMRLAASLVVAGTIIGSRPNDCPHVYCGCGLRINSGGGLSRMHVRDVRGYVFVNPHGQLAGR
jgi:hypothetical protein